MLKLLFALLFCLNMGYILADPTEDTPTGLTTSPQDGTDGTDGTDNTDAPGVADNTDGTDANDPENLSEGDSDIEGDSDTENEETDVDSDTESDTESDTDTDSSTDSDTESDTDSSTDGDEEEEEAEEEVYCSGFLSEEDCQDAMDPITGEQECGFNRLPSGGCYAVVAFSAMKGAGNFDDGFNAAKQESAKETENAQLIYGILGSIIAIMALIIIYQIYYVRKGKRETDSIQRAVSIEIDENIDQSPMISPMGDN